MMDQTTQKRFSVSDTEVSEQASLLPRRPRSGALSVCLEPENDGKKEEMISVITHF